MLRRASFAAWRTSAGASTSSRLSCSSNIAALLLLLLLLLLPLSTSSLIPMLVSPLPLSSISIVAGGITVVPAVVAQAGPSDAVREEAASSWIVSVPSGGRLPLEGLGGAVDDLDNHCFIAFSIRPTASSTNDLKQKS